MLDNYGSHLTEEFFLHCFQAKITILPLPPHTTHKLQPLDVGVFQPYKHFHQADVLKLVNYGVINYGKLDFLNGLTHIRRRALKKSTILSAWEKCGLSPWNPAVVLDCLEDPINSARNSAVFSTKRGYIAPEAKHFLAQEDPSTVQLRAQF